MLKNDILHRAVKNLKNSIQLPVRLQELDGKSNDIIKIANTFKYLVEIKGEIHKSNLIKTLNQLSRRKTFPILVAKSISKSAKEILKRKNMSYLDMAGNCFIKYETKLYIQIEGKTLKGNGIKKKHLAFNKNGIKLIHAFLLKENLVNQTYDTMATAANISKSTIGSILKDLKEQQFLIQLSQNHRRLDNKQQLLEKWVLSYNEKLKPSIYRGKFRFLPRKLSSWKNMDLGHNTFWGGEPAGDILTNYLAPSEWTIYSNSNQSDLIKRLQLVPDPKEGNVHVYSIFWNLQEVYFTNKKHQTVHPILVYADLIRSRNNRNFEVARKIYEQELSAHFTQ